MRTPRWPRWTEALYEERTLVRHHAMRRTLWVFGHDTARAAHHAATLDLLRVQRRLLLGMLEAGGIAEPGAAGSAAAGAEIVELLAETGPLTAREIGARLPALAVPVPVGSGKFATTQAAHSRVLLVLGLRGPGGAGPADRHLDQRPVPLGGQRVLVPRRVRRRADAGPARRRGRAGPPLVARRSVRAPAPTCSGGPAGRWPPRSGRWPTSARSRSSWPRARATCCPTISTRSPSPEPSTALLPGLDPSTMGWKQRDVPPRPGARAAAVRPQRQRRPDAVGGRADRRRLGPAPGRRDRCADHDDVGAEARAALQRQADDLQELLGDVRFSVRFPAPLQAELGS